MINALTVDIEEYFHPAEVQRYTSANNRLFLESRVEQQTDRVLELLNQHSVSATFFILGWVAERTPAVVRSILKAGHEIGCHSYSHDLVYEMTPDRFRQDTMRAVAEIENAAGVRPRAYRAPSYSITSRSLWALEILVECGFEYDSSIVPIPHDRYGIPGFSRHARTVCTPSGSILEIPVATAQLTRRTVIPVGGGAYLRLLPYRYTAAGIRQVNLLEKRPACIYFHPWEIDEEQPRLATSMISRLRTYSQLAHMREKLGRLLTDFRFSTITSVYPRSGQSHAGQK